MLSQLRVMHGWKLSVVAAVYVLSLASRASADTELRWKFTKGDKTNYELQVDMTQDMKLGDAPVQVKAVQIMNMTWEVMDVAADGTALLHQTIDRVRLEANSPLPGAPGLKFDSQDPDAAKSAAIPAMKVYAAMIGKPFVLKMSPQGKTSDFQVPPELLTAIKESENSPGGGMMSEETLKQMLGQSPTPLPTGSVAPGKTWEESVEMNMPMIGKLVTKSEYKYAGPEERNGKSLDKIEVSVVVSADSPDGKVTIKDSKGSGVLYWDSAAGRLQDLNIESKMTTTISVAAQTIDQVMTTKQTMKIVPPKGREL